MTDNIFQELKIALSNQQRLLKRFYGFSIAYQNFEFDEMGINIEEANEEKRKALKIKDKLLNELSNDFKYDIKDESVNILENNLNFLVKFNINESKKTVKFILNVEKDSFILEVDETDF